MKLSETKFDNSETNCCARLDVERWDQQEIFWDKKPFVKDHIRSFLHMPLNFGTVVQRDSAAIERAGAFPEEPLWLADEVSLWGADLFTAIDGDVPDMETETFSGTFLTKVFEGPYSKMGKWHREMDDYVASKGHTAEKTYTFYPTCPKCAKAFGANHVVFFAKVA